MEFKLNEDQQMIHDLAKDFAESVLQPRIDEIEAGEMTEVSNGQKHPQLPHDIHQQLAECGFIGISFPCLLYTSPSPRDPKTSRMPSSA